MNKQTPPESTSEPNQNPDNIPSLQLQQEIEELSQKVDRLQGFFQTLVSGLVIAILITFSIASWFAYRLFIQEQMSAQELRNVAQKEEKILEQVKQIESKLEDLRAEIRADLFQYNQDLAKQDKSLQTYQQELTQLRDRLNQLDTRQKQFTTPVNPTQKPPSAF